MSLTDKPIATFPLTWVSLDDTEEASLYLAQWKSSTARRPHDHPGFLLFMQPIGYNSAAVMYRQAGGGRIIYPFYCCNLTELPYFKNIHQPLKHMVSPYGYGGALYDGDPLCREAASHDFEFFFIRELRRRGFVTEFIRDDVFVDRLACRSVGEVIEQQPNVVVRLQRTAEDIWKSYKAKVRKNVKRAKENGLRVTFDTCGAMLDDFLEVYYGTMERTEASKSFFMSKDKFERLQSTLGSDGGLLYVHVFDGDQIISTELLLLSSDTIYSFLGGTVATAFDKRPNDLLKHEVILWGGANGYKWYVLGGGVTAGDGIFRYKEAFDPESIFPFQVRRVKYDSGAYQLLVEARANYEKDRGQDWQPNPDFFPEFLS